MAIVFPSSPSDGDTVTVDSRSYVYSASDGAWKHSGGSSAGTELSNDSSPQLGGDLDLNSNNITGTGNINTTGSITLTDTDAGSAASPSINLYRNSASPSGADYLGEIDFQGESSTGANRSYAQIKGKIADPTNGTEDGTLEFWIRNNGSNNVTARMNENGILLTDGMTLKYEGATNDSNETILTVEDPTADRTITLPDESGTVSLDSGWKKLGSSNWTSDTGYVDFSVVDPTKYRQYKVVWWISHRNTANSGNQWTETAAVFLTSGGEVTQYDNNVTWRNSSSTTESINSTAYAGAKSQMWLAGNGHTYDSHGEALFTVPNSSSFRAAMRGNSQLIGAPRQGTTAVNYLEEMASVAYNQDPTAITGIRIRSWNGTGYTSQAGNITIFGMEM